MTKTITGGLATGLSGDGIRELVKGLDETVDPSSEQFHECCIFLALNFTWNITMVAGALNCRIADVVRVRSKMRSTGIRKGEMNMLFCEDQSLLAEAVMEFWLLYLVMQGKLKRAFIDEGGEKKSLVKDNEPAGIVQHYERRKKLRAYLAEHRERIATMIEEGGTHVAANEPLKMEMTKIRQSVGYKPRYELQDLLRSVMAILYPDQPPVIERRKNAPKESGETTNAQDAAPYSAEPKKREEVGHVAKEEAILATTGNEMPTPPPPRSDMGGKMSPYEMMAQVQG